MLHKTLTLFARKISLHSSPILAITIFTFAGFFSSFSFASAFVVGLNPQQHSGSFDSAGQGFTKELGTHSLRLPYGHGQGDNDAGVNWAAQNGVGVLYFLGYGVGCDPKTAAGRQCYADRSARLAQKFGNKVQYYEVWNEWNGGFGLGRWPGCKPTCDDTVMYTDLLCRTHKAIKAVNPNAKVVGGGLSYTDTTFINGMLNAGAAKCMDVLSFHPYVQGSVGAQRGGTCPSGTDPLTKANCFLSKITNVDNLVKSKNGGRSIQLAITEEGKSSGANAAAEQASATYLTEIFNRGKNMPVLEGIWWYELKDAPASDVQGYGLVRRNNSKKPSFFAFQAVAKGIPNTGPSPTGPPLPPPPPPGPHVTLTVTPACFP